MLVLVAFFSGRYQHNKRNDHTSYKKHQEAQHLLTCRHELQKRYKTITVAYQSMEKLIWAEYLNKV